MSDAWTPAVSACKLTFIARLLYAALLTNQVGLLGIGTHLKAREH